MEEVPGWTRLERPSFPSSQMSPMSDPHALDTGPWTHLLAVDYYLFLKKNIFPIVD